VHLLRNSFKYASKKDWSAIAADLKPIYTAPSESAALDAFAEFSQKWERKYPAIILWGSRSPSPSLSSSFMPLVRTR
jgi:putative transposase